MQGGQISAVVKKHHLPNDAVFDEKRLFTAGDVSGPYTVNGVRIGTPICEDAWKPDVVETLITSNRKTPVVVVVILAAVLVAVVYHQSTQCIT